MILAQIYKNIPFANIQDTGKWSIHKFLEGAPPEPLKNSIAQVGILHPPILIRNSDHDFDIVCGRQRIECLRDSIKTDECVCRILPLATSHCDILQLLLKDQLSTGPLTLPEQASFLQLSLTFLDENEIFDKFHTDLKLKKSISIFTNILKFDNSILRAIHHGIITDKIIHQLAAFTQEDQRELCNLFSSLHPGVSKQKRILTLCQDIRNRTNISLKDLLAEEEMAKILKPSEQNEPQTTRNLMSSLQKRAYPLLSEAEEFFKSELKQLKLPKECGLSHSQSFEKDEVILSLCFKNIDHLKENLIVVRKIYQSNNKLDNER